MTKIFYLVDNLYFYKGYFVFPREHLEDGLFREIIILILLYFFEAILVALSIASKLCDTTSEAILAALSIASKFCARFVAFSIQLDVCSEKMTLCPPSILGIV